MIITRISPYTRRGTNSTGFTLVELLVVVGIIAVLISVLLPALNAARAQARKLACLSNMRQLGIGLTMYANENQQTLPYQAVDGVYEFADPSAAPNFLASIIPYLKDARVFVCPDAYDPIAFPASLAPDEVSNTNYLGNGVVMGKKLARVSNSSEIIYLQENVWNVNVAWLRPFDAGGGIYMYWHSPYTGWASGETYCSIHDKEQAGNVVYVDGHGDTRAFKGVTAGDFGLNPATEGWGPSNQFASTSGQPYTSQW